MLTKRAGRLRQKVPCPLLYAHSRHASRLLPFHARKRLATTIEPGSISLPMPMRKALIGLRSMDGLGGASVFVSAVHAVYCQDT